MIRVFVLLACFICAPAAHAQGTVSALRPLKQTGLVLGGLAAGGLALHCAGRPECMPGFKAMARKSRDSLLRNDRPEFEYIPAPEPLVGFPGAVRVKSKGRTGAGKQRARWQLPNGDIAEWDTQHGEIEVYDKRGKHKGVADPKTGERIKPAVPGRKIET